MNFIKNMDGILLILFSDYSVFISGMIVRASALRVKVKTSDIILIHINDTVVIAVFVVIFVIQAEFTH